MLTNVAFIIGCDGSSCHNPENEVAYALDDMTDIHFCKLCWTQEMNRRKRTGGQVTPFPGGKEKTAPCFSTQTSSQSRYTVSQGTQTSFEKFQKRQKLED